MVAKFKRFKKRVVKSSLFSYFLLALILGITGFLIFSAVSINQKRAKITQDIMSLQEQIRDLEQKKENLQANISYQESEEYIEEVAREGLNLKSPGEQGVAFIEEEEEEQVPEQEEEKGFLDNILEKLKFW